MFEIKINKNLYLRLRQTEDVEEMFLLTDKNREHLRHWLRWIDTIRSSEDTRKFIEKCKEKFENKTVAAFGIFYDGKLIG